MQLALLCLLLSGLLRTAVSEVSPPISARDPRGFVKKVTDEFVYIKNGMRPEDFYLMESFEDELLYSLPGKYDTKSECALCPGCPITDLCCHSIERLIYDSTETPTYYATHMIDAMGKRQSGVKRGNFRWRGEYFECHDSHPPADRGFDAKWCYLVVHYDPSVPIGGELGTCMPTTCSTQEIQFIYQLIADDLIAQVTNETYPVYVTAVCLKQPSEWTAADGNALWIVIVLGIFLLIGSGYEYYLLCQLGDPAEPNETKKVDESRMRVFEKSLLSFSVIKNTRCLFDTVQKEGNIHCLHGMRFITINWVMLGHTFLFILSYIDNTADLASYYLTHGSFQAIASAEFAVDTFFVMSGLLVTFLAFREMDKSGPLDTWRIITMYIGRYLRLTPAYALVIFLSVSLYSKIGDGPTWPITIFTFKDTCRDYWWTNLLYINNLYPTGLTDMCIGWSWYLGNDMQFFLLAPISIWLLYNYEMIGWAVLGFGLFCDVLITGVLSSVFRIQPDPVGISQLAGNVIELYQQANSSYYGSTTTTEAYVDPKPESEFWSDIYAKPWCRIGAYIIGMGTGYYLHRIKGKLDLNKYIVLIIWCIVAIIQLTLVYGLWGPVEGMYTPSVSAAAFYNCVSRPLWSLGIAWVIVACVCGYAGPIDTFLSWKVFIPLSRLTYCTYLVHPLVITYLYSYRENEMKFDMTTMISYFLATVVLSFAIAYVFAVLIEVPMIGVTKMLLGKGGGGPTQSASEPSAGVVNVNYSNGTVMLDSQQKDGAPTGEYAVSV